MGLQKEVAPKRRIQAALQRQSRLAGREPALHRLLLVELRDQQPEDVPGEEEAAT